MDRFYELKYDIVNDYVTETYSGEFLGYLSHRSSWDGAAVFRLTNHNLKSDLDSFFGFESSKHLQRYLNNKFPMIRITHSIL